MGPEADAPRRRQAKITCPAIGHLSTRSIVFHGFSYMAQR
jgi:hypothetical protein